MATILENVLAAVKRDQTAVPPLERPTPGTLSGQFAEAVRDADNAAKHGVADIRKLRDPREFFGRLAEKAKHRDDPSDLAEFTAATHRWDRGAMAYSANRKALADQLIEQQSVSIAKAIEASEPLPEARSREQILVSLRARKAGICRALALATDLAVPVSLRLQAAFAASIRRYISETLVPTDRALADELGFPYVESQAVNFVSGTINSLRQQLGPPRHVGFGLSDPRNWCPWTMIPRAK